MAAVVDWLNAYPSSDLGSVIEFFADDALIQCGCGGGPIINGLNALRAYWKQRLLDHPDSELDDLGTARGVAITDLCQGLPVRCEFEFDAAGQISFTYLRPLKLNVALR